MPWNDNSKPGPWGSPPSGGGDDGPRGEDPGPRSPWGAPPPGGGRPNRPQRPKRPRPPGRRNEDFEALTRHWRDRAERFFRGPDGRGVRPGAVAVVAGVALGLWALSGVYIVQPNEQAVVTRFGAYVRSEQPGLRVRLPFPFEHVDKVSVTSLNRIDVGGASSAANVAEESLMLTGDENIVDLDFSVTWRINDADNFLFRVADPEATVKAVAESAMREVVGRTPFQSVVSAGRARVQQQAEQLMQAILNSYGAGITVVEVQIRGAEPPREVIDAFRDVARAGQNAEAAINEANTYRNRVVNEAVGDAAAIRQQAEGYRQSVVSEAEGEAARFNQLYGEYRAAPGVTRDRLYLETMEKVFARSNKIVVDGQGTSAPIILSPEMFKQRAAPAAAPPAQSQTQGAAR